MAGLDLPFLFYDYKSMIYDDLFSVPFKLNGRDMSGMDCYGLVIEMCKRNGKTLKDISRVHVNQNELDETAGQLNVFQIPEHEAKKGDVIQCTWNSEIHIAFMLDDKVVIHATSSGVRITPILALMNRKYFRVED